MYDILIGPMAWVSFGVLMMGLVIRILRYIRGLDWKLDRVAYTKNISFGVKGALRSVVLWLFPFGTRSWRDHPVFTVLVFLFHIGLLTVPVFLTAHNILLKEKWGFSLWTLSENAADGIVLLVITTGLLLVLRRVALPEVRKITDANDLTVMLLAITPFVTGYLAHHQASTYGFWLYAHIISGEILLMAIPFTKLSHFALFFMSRVQLGMDFGIKRGGMKGKGMAW